MTMIIIIIHSAYVLTVMRCSADSVRVVTAVFLIGNLTISFYFYSCVQVRACGLRERVHVCMWTLRNGLNTRSRHLFQSFTVIWKPDFVPLLKTQKKSTIHENYKSHNALLSTVFRWWRRVCCFAFWASGFILVTFL